MENKNIVIIDTETTGLLEPMGTDLNLQPHIVEIYAAKISPETNEIIQEVDTLIKPPIPIPAYISKINGIDDGMVQNAPAFIEVYKEIIEVFFGAWEMVAANLMFDQGMIITELERLGKEYHFPYPPEKFCVIEQSMHLKGYRLKNQEITALRTGEEAATVHRAKADAWEAYENYKWLKQCG